MTLSMSLLISYTFIVFCFVLRYFLYLCIKLLCSLGIHVLVPFSGLIVPTINILFFLRSPWLFIFLSFSFSFLLFAYLASYYLKLLTCSMRQVIYSRIASWMNIHSYTPHHIISSLVPAHSILLRLFFSCCCIPADLIYVGVIAIVDVDVILLSYSIFLCVQCREEN